MHRRHGPFSLRSMRPQARHHYDHRVRQAIVATGNPRLFPHLRIPSSTARSWIRRGSPPVVSATDDLRETVTLEAEIAELRAKATFYFALASVLLVVVRTFKLRLDVDRVPNARDKANLLRAIRIASRTVPRRRILDLIGLSPGRLNARRRRSLRCQLEDQSTCPRTRPSRLTAKEVQQIKRYVLDPSLRHMSLQSLSVYAQRRNEVFASRSTWRRLILERGWHRPRVRVYPAKPRVGIRARRPNEWWHLDLTVIRLVSGTKIYLHAVMDNFSRKVLAWRLSERIFGQTTTDILKHAAQFLDGDEVRLMTDSGVENVNHIVDDYLSESPIRRVLAQVEIAESNSMIEAFWKSLRHQWLYLHNLDSLATVRTLVEFYVDQHNSVMPHSAFDGQTPDEVYFGRPSVAPLLRTRRLAARATRLDLNRMLSCAACEATPAGLSIPSPQPVAT